MNLVGFDSFQSKTYWCVWFHGIIRGYKVPMHKGLNKDERVYGSIIHCLFVCLFLSFFLLRDQNWNILLLCFNVPEHIFVVCQQIKINICCLSRNRITLLLSVKKICLYTGKHFVYQHCIGIHMSCMSVALCTSDI